jgi:phosphate transport system permease protein
VQSAITSIWKNRPKTLRKTARIDRYFRATTLALACVVPIILIVLGVTLYQSALPSMRLFGAHFLTTSIWDPVHDKFGVLFAIFGTVVSSALALLIAVPVSIGTAVFLAELAPRWLSDPLSFLVELLAAVPSIVYGLWGIVVLVPFLQTVEVWLGAHAGNIPLFSGPPQGYCLLAAGLVLAIMILPYITSVSREVIKTVPTAQREAAYALGATRWEVIRGPILRYVRTGILGAIILGLGRALGETMAVTMVIGNTPIISASLFNPGYTMPSLLANEFAEATENLHRSALVEVALALVLVTIIVNGIARLLIWSVAKNDRQGAQV